MNMRRKPNFQDRTLCRLRAANPGMEITCTTHHADNVHPMKTVAVFYGCEGAAGAWKRIEAWSRHNGGDWKMLQEL